MKLLWMTCCMTLLIPLTGCLLTESQQTAESIGINSADQAPMSLTPGPVEGELLPSARVLAEHLPTPQLYKLDESLSHMYLLPNQQRLLDFVLIGPGTMQQTRRFYSTEMKAAGWSMEHLHQKGNVIDLEFRRDSEVCRLELSRRIYNQTDYTVVKLLLMPLGSQRKDL